MEKVKLTKSALNKFITWSSTKYNDWLGYGTKKQNVEFAFKLLNDGNKSEEIQCANPSGENPHRGSRKYWKTKQSGGKYLVNGFDKSITNLYTNEALYFI